MTVFRKILIANRGEIACRVMRSARALGYATVAVYSDADAHALHVEMADEAVRIGAAPASESYLKIEAVIDAARRTGADAVHPGYGFLSENADFAQACLDAGLVFIGPPPAAIRAMGDKALAKQRMIAAGVPCAPGYLGAYQDDATLGAEAKRLGFPLLAKAVAGGGGRGMRLVRSADELAEAIAGARREALSAFGDGSLMLERLIERGRHIEIQVFADAHGNAIHLGERDCTAQRRRQKVIEESPSPVVGEALRGALGRDAVAAALAVGYRGAGTVEFIVDAELKHYFLEMNTRLQVEHPVTEMVTGFDLVEWQLRIAAGAPLPVTQDEVRLRGHAIEARLYAEDPYAGFAPQTGTVLAWDPDTTATRAGVRIDSGIRTGSEVSPYYDAMVAKLIAHGRDRDEAIRRLRAALAATPLLGISNNGGFLADLLDHPAFRGAAMHTTLLDEWQAQGEPLLQRPQPSAAAWCVAALALTRRDRPGWRADSVAAYDLDLECGPQKRRLRVGMDRDGHVRIESAGVTSELRVLEFAGGQLRYEQDGIIRRAHAVVHEAELQLALDGASFVFVESPAVPAASATADARRVRAPVAGVVAKVAVVAGDPVEAGQPLACVEAMKMEMWLHAPAAGRVAAVNVGAGEQVASGAVLIELELDEARPA